MAQLGGGVKADQDAVEAKRNVSRKMLFAAAEVLHDDIERLSRQQHELAGRYDEIARLL